MTKPSPTATEGVKSLREADVANLDWALKFMQKYERKHRDRLPRPADTVTSPSAYARGEHTGSK